MYNTKTSERISMAIIAATYGAGLCSGLGETGQIIGVVVAGICGFYLDRLKIVDRKLREWHASRRMSKSK